MKIKITLSALFLSGLTLGCAHNHVRGSVALVHSDSDADICLGSTEVVVGDKVSIFRNICKSPKTVGLRGASAMQQKCEKKYMGLAEVTGILDDHYSTIKVIDQIQLEPGLIVEKK